MLFEASTSHTSPRISSTMGKPFGASTPALEVIEGIDLTGKTAVVTGGNRCYLDPPLLDTPPPRPNHQYRATDPPTQSHEAHIRSGIGVETVRALASAGARVLMTSRSVEAGQKVADRLKADGVKVSNSIFNPIHLTCCALIVGGQAVGSGNGKDRDPQTS